MKILLTGEPHSGKSTLINKVLAHFDQKIGFVTNEILRDDQRVGFELIASTGVRATLASTEYASDIRVSKYGVEPTVLNEFIKTLPEVNRDSLLYIDEIGQMQLYSDAFRKLVEEYITNPNNFVGTLSKVYDHELIQRLRQDSRIEVIEVTPQNRDLLVEEISSKLSTNGHTT